MNRLAVLVLISAILTGCATMSPDRKQELGQALMRGGFSMAAQSGEWSPLPVSPWSVIGKAGNDAIQNQYPSYYGDYSPPVEEVRVVKVMDTDYKAIIQRRNGELYLIEYGVGVIPIWHYEGKTVLIYSPGLFLGVGSSIILPDEGQKARIWNSEQIQ